MIKLESECSGTSLLVLMPHTSPCHGRMSWPARFWPLVSNLWLFTWILISFGHLGIMCSTVLEFVESIFLIFVILIWRVVSLVCTELHLANRASGGCSNTSKACTLVREERCRWPKRGWGRRRYVCILSFMLLLLLLVWEASLFLGGREFV